MKWKNSIQNKIWRNTNYKKSIEWIKNIEQKYGKIDEQRNRIIQSLNEFKKLSIIKKKMEISWDRYRN